MTREEEVMQFLSENVFNPILNSSDATDSLKRGVNYTIMRMNQRNAAGMIHYYWSAIIGTERSTQFARQMREEGFTRFEEVIDEFRRVVKEMINEHFRISSVTPPEPASGDLCASVESEPSHHQQGEPANAVRAA